ncbi:MAG TPA: extracellular solute-binding protein [Chthonomonadaceae bacterium]|nr:extracellular solute-binding protein [Chthonomonadaceae bacterium]
MAEPVLLKGIAWNHTRGFLPMVATAQRFGETHPGVEIVWQKRSLQEFADYPIEKLAETFDLLVIDHPFAGYAAAHPALLPLDEWLPADFLADQAANSVGVSHVSYQYGGHQWALAIDAATPCSAHRPDLLAQHNVGIPQTWQELMELARRGLAAVPALAVDCLMHWYMFCCGLGEAPFQSAERIVSEEIGADALEHLRALVTACGPQCFDRNPIATYEAMTAGDALAYCPFAYTYSNYARPGYARTQLKFGGLVALDNGQTLGSTLGGTGLAISARCPHREVAAAYAQYVASPDCQRGLYFTSGGQPGHRQAWLDPAVNAASNDFFFDTLPTLDTAYLRPRYDGYIPFQDQGGPLVQRYLRAGGDPRSTLAELERLYRGQVSRLS